MSEAGTRALAPHVIGAGEAADREALRHLVAAYCHGADRRDYDLLRSLYHPGATDDHRPWYEGSAEGFIDFLPRVMAGWRATLHTPLSMLFALDGDHAEGEIVTRAWHLTADGTSQHIIWGRYVDRYARREGVWRFAHRSLILDFAETVPVSEDSQLPGEGEGTGRAGADDPVHARLALFARGR